MSLVCSVSLQIEVLLCAWECLETDDREAGYSRSAAAWMRSQKKRNDKEERQWGIQYVARILRQNLRNIYPVILLMWGLKILALVSMNSSKHVALQHKKHTTSLFPRTLAANYHQSLCCSGQSYLKRREIISTSCRGRSICSKTRVLLTAGELMKYLNCVSLASFHMSLDN